MDSQIIERKEQSDTGRDLALERLRAGIAVPVESFDERFTSVLADGDDARAAAHLLSGYLQWRTSS